MVVDRNHRIAVRFFWAWLILTALVSLTGNMIHAWIGAPTDSRWLAVGVAAVPPIALLLSVHGLAVLAKVSASGRVYRAALTATAMLAAGAFLLSFVALCDLAIIAGIRPELAPVLPIVIDLAIGVATLALVAIDDKPVRHRSTSARSATESASGASKRAPNATAIASSAIAARDKLAPTATDSPRWIADDATRELAVQLVAAKVTRQSAGTVERILVAHSCGDPLNRIAKNVGVHHTAVSKVLGAAQLRRSVEVAPT